jgi:hypothetical protein
VKLNSKVIIKNCGKTEVKGTLVGMGTRVEHNEIIPVYIIDLNKWIDNNDTGPVRLLVVHPDNVIIDEDV